MHYDNIIHRWIGPLTRLYLIRLFYNWTLKEVEHHPSNFKLTPISGILPLSPSVPPRLKFSKIESTTPSPSHQWNRSTTLALHHVHLYSFIIISVFHKWRQKTFRWTNNSNPTLHVNTHQHKHHLMSSRCTSTNPTIRYILRCPILLQLGLILLLYNICCVPWLYILGFMFFLFVITWIDCLSRFRVRKWRHHVIITSCLSS